MKFRKIAGFSSDSNSSRVPWYPSPFHLAKLKNMTIEIHTSLDELASTRCCTLLYSPLELSRNKMSKR